MKIIGHRGCAGLEPENTLRAFKKALELDVDEVELDVRESADGYLVVIHDRKVGLGSGRKSLVRKMSLKRLRRLNLGKGEKIPTLEEVLNFFKGRRIILNIEIKSPGYEKSVVDLIRNYQMRNQVVIISFWPDVLKKVRELDSQVKTGLDIRGGEINLVELYKDLGIIRLFLKHNLVTSRLVSEFHSVGMEMIAWTVNKPKDIEKMIKLGVDGICSDYPDRVIDFLSV